MRGVINLLNRKQAAQYLGISLAGLDRLRKNGKIPEYHVTWGVVRFSQDDLNKHIIQTRRAT